MSWFSQVRTWLAQAGRQEVLVVGGEKDLITLEHSEQLAQWLGNGQLVVIPGAGHAAPVAHAEKMDKLVAGFLSL